MGTRGVVVGQVEKVRPHPGADRIWIADVNIGRDCQPQIVWGGQKLLEEGSLVAVAPPGSWLPESGKIRRRRYRGEWSQGMLCSLAELGWDATVTDRVALLDGTSGLRPGESLDDRRDWRSIVRPDQLERSARS